MICNEITAILNAHGAQSLTAARRAAVDGHLAECADCARSWLAADMLRRERWPSGPPGLLGRITGRLDDIEDIDSASRAEPGQRAPLRHRGRARLMELVLGEGLRDTGRARTARVASPARHGWSRVGLLAASIIGAVSLGVLLGRTASLPGAASVARIAPPSLTRAGEEPDFGSDTTGPGAGSSAAVEPGRHYRLVPAAPAVAQGDGASRSVAELVAAAAVGLASDASTAGLAGALPARVGVVQFFMYGCYPCYTFEPQIEGWRTAAEHVELFRVPVVFNAASEVHARAFYAAEALGVLDAMHGRLFAEVHELGNALDTQDALIAFFATLGIDEATFASAFGSAEVAARVAAAIELARLLDVTGTPALVVGGLYLTSPSMAGGYADTLAIVDALVASLRDDADRCPRAGRARDEQAEDAGDPVRHRPEPHSLRELLERIERGSAIDNDSAAGVNCTPLPRIF